MLATARMPVWPYGGLKGGAAAYKRGALADKILRSFRF